MQDRKPRFQEANAMMSAPDDGPDPAVGASRVGAELRAARLRLGWNLPDVATALRIRLPYLEAIEDGRLADLPGNAYAMGFLRSYATMLGLDAGEVARRFRAEAAEVDRKPVLSFPAPVPQRGVPAGAVVLLGVLLAAGVYASWYRFSGDRPGAAVTVPAVPERLAPLADRALPPSNPSPQVASIVPSTVVGNPAPVTPVPAAPPPPPPVAVLPPPPPLPAAETGKVVLRVKSDSWIQVREKQGPVLLNRVMRAGESWPMPKGTPLLLTTGNAGATELLVAGVAAPSLGATGTVRRDVAVDPDATKPGGALPRPAAASTPAQ